MKVALVNGFILSLVLVLLSVVAAQTPSGFQYSDGDLRSHILNFEIDDTLKKAYFEDSVFLDEISIKYGNFGPLSFSSGAAATLNPAIIAQIAQDVAAFWAPRTTADFNYLEFNGNGGINFNVTGLATIAADLAGYVAVARLYGQEHDIGQILVTQIDDDRYSVVADSRVRGHVANPFTVPQGTYPTSFAQTIQFDLKGRTVNEYVRIRTANSVTFLLDQLRSYFRSETILPAAGQLSILPYSSYADYPSEYPQK